MIPNTLPRSLQENPRLDRWFGFAAGRVRVAVGKVELGQGVLTALAQIAAEELDVELHRIDLVAGDTDAAPDEAVTASSLSIEVSGASLRLAGAETRALFLQRAAQDLGCAPSELAIVDGAVLRAGRPTGEDYWTLAARVSLARDASGTVPAKPRAAHRIVGAPAARLDLPGKVFGSGFIHDLSFPGLLHARVLRQPSRGARLVGLDEEAIRRAGAVRILRRGNFVALVAEREAEAQAAALAAPSCARWEDVAALAPAQQEAAWLRGQRAEDVVLGRPAPMPAGLRRHAALYSRPYLAHAALAPSCAIAWFENGHLTVWSHTQGVYPLRQMLVEMLGLSAAAISVRHAQGAGCYGHNGADDAAVDAAVVAMETPGRPVRVLWRREDEFGFEPVGSAMLIRLEAALEAAGRPACWATEIWSAPQTGRAGAAAMLARQALPDPPPFPHAREVPQPLGGAMRNAVPLYDIPDTHVRLHLVQPAPVRTSSLRSLGAMGNVFAIESFLDELAVLVGADPLAYRLALLADPRARRVVERVAAFAGWPSRGAGGDGTGMGLGFARYKNLSGYAAVVAEVQVDEEVRLRRLWCAADCGLAVNPDGLRNQLEGGMVQAASWVLKEQVKLAGSGIASLTWADYPILRFSEIPEVTVELIDAGDTPPLGAGEATMGPTAGAIGNAVAHALGARLRDLPLSRDRIMATLLQS
jgi:CO/xanthine dehydrogenase Mo-binding subunit